MLKYFKFQPLSRKRYAYLVFSGFFFYFLILYILGFLEQAELLTYALLVSPLLLVVLISLQVKRFFSITSSRLSLLACVCIASELTLSYYSLVGLSLSFLPDDFYSVVKSYSNNFIQNFIAQKGFVARIRKK